MRRAHNTIDLTGQRFGRITVLERAGSNVFGGTRWRVRCDCGTVFETDGNSLRRGGTRSCGCYRIEKAREQCPKMHIISRRPVTLVSPDGGVIVIPSVREAAETLGCVPSTIIHHIASGKPFKSYIIKTT